MTVVIRGGRAAQKLATRARIGAAAWELFSTQGYDATTTKEIAKKAGVAAGTVFVHARDKADLLCLVMHDRLEQAVERQLATLPEGPLLERLLHVFRGVFRMYGEHQGVAAAFIRIFPAADGPNGQRVASMTFGFLHRLAALISEAQARGELDPEVQPLLLAQNAFALYFFALNGWLQGYTTLETALEPGLRMSLALQLRGLTRISA